MGGGPIGKLILTMLVIWIVWRGLRLWAQVQVKLAEGEARKARAKPPARTLDLLPCPSCGTYVPQGAPCPACGAGTAARRPR